MENIKFTCSICNRTFTRNCALSYHLNHNNHSFNNCLFCGKQISSNKKFCNRSCSASYNNKIRVHYSDDWKKKISETLKNKYKDRPQKVEDRPKDKPKKEKFFCKECGKEIRPETKTGYCGIHFRNHLTDEIKEKLSKAGRKSVYLQKEIRRSKNEIYFSELINKRFSDSINNEPIFNGWDADIIIPSLKIAILWNGAWHYNDICGQLKQVQNRDKIKYSEIIKAGYMPYIIVDLGNFSKEKCEFEYNRFISFLNLIM